MPDVDATAWNAAVVTAGGSVSTKQQNAIDALCVGLKADSVFTKLFRFWPIYAETATEAKIDFVARASLTPVASPTFTALAGYLLNGTSQYLDLGTTGAGTLNSESFGFDLLTNKAVGTTVEVGTSNNTADFSNNISVKWSDGNTYFAANDANLDAGRAAPSNTVGIWVVSRTTSALVTAYQNSSSVGTETGTSTAIPTHNYLLGAGNDHTGTVSLFSNVQFGMVFLGTGLTATDVANLTARWNTYKATVSASIGTLNITEAADTISATANLSGPVGTLSITEAADTISATATLSGPVGTLSITEAADTISATGTVTSGGTATGTLSITEADDTISASATGGGAAGSGAGSGFHFIDDGKGRERVRGRRRDAAELREEIVALVAGRPAEERTIEDAMTLPAVAELRREYPHVEIADMRAEIADILAALRAEQEDEEEAVIMLLAA